MGLTTSYVLATNRLQDIFSKIRDGQAPDRLSQQLLKDWGFTSSNDKAFIPLLKSLGFLTAEGKPTQRYADYRDHSRSKHVMADALRDTYSDLFLIKEHPTAADRESIKGKFKSFHNVSDNVADLMTKTFYALLGLAELTKRTSGSPSETSAQPKVVTAIATSSAPQTARAGASLHYNIQIHLPATKDVEVYNAIFKSLREHLVEP
jgi:Family of unknown function (DUF5343)